MCTVNHGGDERGVEDDRQGRGAAGIYIICCRVDGDTVVVVHGVDSKSAPRAKHTASRKKLS
jgi:hypothetical protein